MLPVIVTRKLPSLPPFRYRLRGVSSSGKSTLASAPRTQQLWWRRLPSSSTKTAVFRIGLTKETIASTTGKPSFVDVPPAGTVVGVDDPLVTFEAEKAVGEIVAPTAGKILQLNSSLKTSGVKLVAEDPEGEGWLLDFAPHNAVDFDLGLE